MCSGWNEKRRWEKGEEEEEEVEKEDIFLSTGVVEKRNITFCFNQLQSLMVCASEECSCGECCCCSHSPTPPPPPLLISSTLVRRIVIDGDVVVEDH